MAELHMQKEKTLRVCFLHISTGAISWYRMVQYAQHMMDSEDIYPYYPRFDATEADKKWRDYEQNPDDKLADLEALFEVADVVVVGTVHSLKLWSTLVVLRNWFKVPIVTECDDHPFEIDGAHDNFRHIGVGSDIEENSYDQIKESDGVVCSTEYLADVLRGYNRNVHVVPNALDPERWKFDDKPDNGSEVVLGWAGAFNHKRDLSLVKKPFEILLDKYPNLRIKCLHGAIDLIKHERFSNDTSWAPILEYPRKLAAMAFDIAVAPLWDSEFNRAKSNLRYLEYSALSVPTVASRVLPYMKSIDDGMNGYLASGTEEWVDKISNLIDSKDERIRIGKAAYRNVFLKYNSRNVARDYADLLKNIHLDVRRSDVHLCSTAG